MLICPTIARIEIQRDQVTSITKVAGDLLNIPSEGVVHGRRHPWAPWVGVAESICAGARARSASTASQKR